ncbi:hypothetical protein NW754_010730 [Fusarium falciforme]|nr:hypothetical protein NW754_010730 [Fusarium falciforme]KAJ4184039.1 hypothetical protein NW767_013382 [Fusarium falciforme]KAJ4255313.1 hypothetical protein NW757_004828 [Fusarium falciforme]
MCHISYTAALCVHCDHTQFLREQSRVKCQDVRNGRSCQGQSSSTSYSDFVCDDCFQEQAANDDNLYTTTRSKKK